MNLTLQNRKTLQQERSIAYVFAGIVIAFAGLFNFIYLMLSKDINWLTVILADSGVFTLSFLIPHSMNRQLNKDLKENHKTIRIEKVEKKEMETSWEAGSATLNIPLLASFFPKLFAQEMKASYKWVLFINGFPHEVDQRVFENVDTGEEVEMHYAHHSDTLLQIDLPANSSQSKFHSQQPVLSHHIW